MTNSHTQKDYLSVGTGSFDDVITAGGRAVSSIREYEADKRYAIAWMESAGYSNLKWPFDWETLKHFLSDHFRELNEPHNTTRMLILKGLRKKESAYKWNTMCRRIEGIGVMCQIDGGKPFRLFPKFLEAVRGMRREWACAELQNKELAEKKTKTIYMGHFWNQLELLKRKSKSDPLALRDLALISIWFWSGGRRIADLDGMRKDHIKYETEYGAKLKITVDRQKRHLEPQTFIIRRDSTQASRRDTKYGFSPVSIWLEWAMVNETDYAFPAFSRGRQVNRPLSKDGLREAFKRVFPSFNPHSLRATYIKLRKDQNWQNNRIARQTGHKSTKILDDYDLGV